MANNHMTLEAECTACGGTGIYHGFAEPDGVGVVCLKCEGSGMMVVHYIPFTGRKKRNDIVVVRRSRGSFIAIGVGPTGESVTYEEFLQGKLP